MNPHYLAIALVLGASLVSTASVLAATQGIEPARAEMRTNDTEKPFTGTVSSVTGTTVLVSAKSGSSPMLSTYTVDASNAKVFRVGKPAAAEGQPVETALTLSALKSGDQVAIKGTKDDAARTVVATEIRVGEIALGLNRDGDGVPSVVNNEKRPTTTSDMGPRRDEKATSSVDAPRPVKNEIVPTTTSQGEIEKPVKRGFWAKFKGFFGF